MLVWFRRLLSTPPDRAPRGSRPAPRDRELVARTEEFNHNAETYWRALAEEPSGRAHVLNKPFGNVAEAPAMLYRLGLALAELHLGVGHVVLDFGAGSCWLSSCLNRLGCRAIAVDVSPSALGLGRELFSLDRRHRPGLEPAFLPYDGHRLPLADATVDRVICFDALHHVPNLDEVLSELARVLRPGGRAVLAEPGEGHSQTDHSLFDSESFGVLENDLAAEDIERRALRAGFSRMRLKPYPDPAAVSVSVADYLRLMDGDTQPYPWSALQEALRQFLIVVLSKGDEVYDSRFPNELRAEIEQIDGGVGLRGRNGTVLPVRLRVHNRGDTVWRHEIDEVGGYVMLSGHLRDAHEETLTRGFIRTPLPCTVPPGGSVDLVADVLLPAESGRYRVRVDLVDEQVTWFSQAGSAALDLDLEVDPAAPPSSEAGLKAEITAEIPPNGLRARPSAQVSLPLNIRNIGLSPWPQTSVPTPGGVSLGAHLLDAGGTTLVPDFFHLAMTTALAPGAAVDICCRFAAPSEPGAFRLKLDMVQEHVCWFEHRGSRPIEIPLFVEQQSA